MDTGQFAYALDLLYTDKMTVRKLISETGSDGTTNNIVSDVVWGVSKCRASYKKLDAPYELYENGEPILTEVKIICPTSIQVNAGDWLTVERQDSGRVMTTITGYAGHPAVYGTHQEITLVAKGRA